MIGEIVNAALGDLSKAFAGLYTDFGGLSIAPEGCFGRCCCIPLRHPLGTIDRAAGVRPLFRWFVGLGVEDLVWDHSTCSKNRNRLLEGEIAAKFLSAVLAQPKVKRLLSSDHFSVDAR
ncbi:hypothetical protein ACVWW4_004035 [Bradyrhizobium sp. LB7.1]